ncbi:MAG: succinate dehydrogenase assembly factor 4 [Candidatus Puniceispirillum sp.]
MERHKKNTSKAETETADQAALPVPDSAAMPHEVNGPKGPEPTRYGDWEQKGRCTDF